MSDDPNTVWLRTSIGTGDVTLHRQYRPRVNGEAYRDFFNRDGALVREVLGGLGNVTAVWLQMNLED